MLTLCMLAFSRRPEDDLTVLFVEDEESLDAARELWRMGAVSIRLWTPTSDPLYAQWWWVR